MDAFFRVYLNFGCDIMKKTRIFSKTIHGKRSFIDRLATHPLIKNDSKHFTRNRNLPITRLLMLLLSGVTTSLQLAVDDFYEKINCKEDTVSKQAVSKARTNLDPNIIKELFTMTVKEVCKCSDLELYNKKYRLCAIDGSDIALDNADALKEYFGCSGSAKNATTAMASVAYDPLNNIILDASLNPYKTDERTAAREHIAVVSRLPKKKKVQFLFIFDRGYPSREFLSELIDGKACFLMRARAKFNLGFDNVQRDENVTFEHAGKSYSVRVMKVVLDSGEIETLVTNLSEKDLPYSEAGDLYFKRWAIETKFNSLKNKLELENMSGRRPVTVFQDFWATLDMANTTACFEYMTNEVISEKTANKNNKNEQTTNENRLIHKLSQKFIEVLTQRKPSKQQKLFDELVQDIAKRPSEIKPNRKSKRKIPRKMKFCDRYKSIT